MQIHVLPLKNGLFRTVNVSPEPQVIDGAVWMSPRMLAHWTLVYRRWWATKGHRLALSPEMWMEHPR